MNKKMKQQLKSAFQTPAPTRKTEFLANIDYPTSTTFEFYLSQVGYIRKRFWFLSLLVMAVMFILLNIYVHEYEIVGLLSAALPLLTLFGITEISKSSSFHMDELEMSCKYNLGRITLLRLLVIGSFQFVILAILLIAFAGKSDFGVLRYVLYSTTPFLLCTYLSLLITNILKSRDALYSCYAVTGFMSICILLLHKNWTGFYADQATTLWAFAFGVTVALLLREIKNLIKQKDELVWNFA